MPVPEGNITASNVIYSLLAGTGIAVTGGQNPTISHTGVLNIGGISGSLSIGEGLEVSDSTLTNTGVLSLNGESGDLELIEGSGITIDGLEISADTTTWTFAVNGTSQDDIGNGDTLDFVSGNDIDITRSAANKMTIALEPSIDTVTTINIPDGGFLNLASIVHDDTSAQGLRLPQATSATPS